VGRQWREKFSGEIAAVQQQRVWRRGRLASSRAKALDDLPRRAPRPVERGSWLEIARNDEDN
jgi:hypothetical protein